jgi:putative NADH-flavin reductase
VSTVLVLGAGGRSGSAAARELLGEGHEVVAATRRPGPAAHPVDPRARRVVADLTDVGAVARAAAGCDVVVDATRQAGAIPVDRLVRLHEGVRDALALAGVARLVVVGGAGALRLATGRWFWEHPAFAARTTPRGAAHARLREHLETRTTPGLTWSYLIPPPDFAPDGERTGQVSAARPGGAEDDHLGRAVSYADFAYALARHVGDPAASGVLLVCGDAGVAPG